MKNDKTDPNKMRTTVVNQPISLVDPVWETLDPTPDIHSLFLDFNQRFFWNKLSSVVVSWSPRMTL